LFFPICLYFNRTAYDFPSLSIFPSKQLRETMIAQAKKQEEAVCIPGFGEVTASRAIGIVNECVKR
jgi:hypothetical protein